MLTLIIYQFRINQIDSKINGGSTTEGPILTKHFVPLNYARIGPLHSFWFPIGVMSKILVKPYVLCFTEK